MIRQEAAGPRVWLSMHDVMPETLPQVRRQLATIHRLQLPPPTLLVVPGRAWAPDDLQQLHDWVRQGHRLAAHGWHHRARHVRGAYHRLHAGVLSRDAAEHLALSRAEIVATMRRSHDWFGRHGLPSPRLYVPPAWALGRISAQQLRALPFTHVETLSGVITVASGRIHRLPLLGFEADTPARALMLRAWNRSQLQLAQCGNRLLRVGLHPDDDTLYLADTLAAQLRAPMQVASSAPDCIGTPPLHNALRLRQAD